MKSSTATIIVLIILLSAGVIDSSILRKKLDTTKDINMLLQAKVKRLDQVITIQNQQIDTLSSYCQSLIKLTTDCQCELYSVLKK